MRLYLDIETVGHDDPATRAEAAASISPPKTMSKPETIAKWEAEEKPALVEDAIKKGAFDGALGRVVCIGYAVNDDAVQTVADAQELHLLGNAFQAIDETMKGMQTVRVIGHNVAWDVRFLWQRAVINGLRPPKCLLAAVKAKPWEIEDTMLLWNPERDRKISLDKLCKTLRVPTPKSEMDGSKVWERFKAGDIESIRTYCAGDVAAMRECHRKMVA